MIFWFWCFNATFSNISAISWRPVLVVEEAGVPEENHRPLGKQPVSFITCGCESSAPFLVIYKANPRCIGDKKIMNLTSAPYVTNTFLRAEVVKMRSCYSDVIFENQIKGGGDKTKQADLRQHRLVSTWSTTALMLLPHQLFIYVLNWSNEAIVLASFGPEFHTCAVSYL